MEEEEINQQEEEEIPQETKIKKLPADTVRRLKSETVIKDLVSVTKELIENSLDASSGKISISLEKQGMEGIIIEDSGKGISKGDYYTFGKIHHTSKISNFSELDLVQTYGFRGEGFSSVCNLAREVRVFTKTKEDESVTLLSLDRKGEVVSKSTLHQSNDTNIQSQGTKIIIKGIFESQPVRRDYWKNHASSQAKKMYDLVVEYCLIQPQIHFVFHDPPKPRFEKKPCKDTKEAIADLFRLDDELFEFKSEGFDVDDEENPNFRFHIFVPKKDADLNHVSRSNSDNQYFYVNYRPIHFTQVNRMFNQKMRAFFDDKKKSFLFFFLHIRIPTTLYDVNFDPSKRTLKFHNDGEILSKLEELIDGFFPPKPKQLNSSDKQESINKQIESLIRSEEEENNFIDGDASLKRKLPSVEPNDQPLAKQKLESGVKNINVGKIDLNEIRRKMERKIQNLKNEQEVDFRGELDNSSIHQSIIVGKLEQQGCFLIKIGSIFFFFDALKASERLNMNLSNITIRDAKHLLSKLSQIPSESWNCTHHKPIFTKCNGD